jgi:hypothetical protein
MEQLWSRGTGTEETESSVTYAQYPENGKSSKR